MNKRTLSLLHYVTKRFLDDAKIYNSNPHIKLQDRVVDRIHGECKSFVKLIVEQLNKQQ